MNWLPNDDMGRWLLFIAIAGGWIFLLCIFNAWAKSMLDKTEGR